MLDFNGPGARVEFNPPMDRFTRGYYRQCAKLKFVELKRQEFQAWFGQVMSIVHPTDYENIRLTHGDGALDGIMVSSGTVFQVYAPREQSQSEIVAKIEEDFQTASGTMAARNAAMQAWVFVHNDEGLTKETGPALVKLRQQNPGVVIERWTFERIWKEIENLDLRSLADLFGLGPTEANVDQLRFQEIREVIAYLKRHPAPAVVSVAPPDVGKLEHNRLSDDNAELLRVGRRRQGDVEAFLEGLTDPTSGEDIAEGFRQHYRGLRDAGMTADEIFDALWDYAGGHHFCSPAAAAAVTAVLAYFFASCDIFENVPAQK